MSEGAHVVRIEAVTKEFGDVTAVADADFGVRDGEFLTLLGPSGAGKTTLLHMIAGFVTPTSGEIYIDGEAVSDRAPYERNIGMVFQDLALFPHMTVGENVAFPLKMRRTDPGDVDRRVAEAMDLVRLPREYTDSPVGDLSGGQQQRVAIARAVVFEPTLLLLDEPLSSLDKKLREEMRAELSRIHAETDLTIVHVTHNQTEALSMADRVAVMRRGEIEQLSPKHDLYADPTSPFVAEFVGDTTLVEGTATGDRTVDTGSLAVEIDRSLDPDTPVTLGIRAEKIRIGDAVETTNRFPGTVEQVSFEGARTQYEVTAGDHRFAVVSQNVADRQVHAVGDAVEVGWEPGDTFVWTD
ncbi:MAG: ABC transporter ATP-binding protein [Haloarculaceae archaeon]